MIIVAGYQVPRYYTATFITTTYYNKNNKVVKLSLKQRANIKGKNKIKSTKRCRNTLMKKGALLPVV